MGDDLTAWLDQSVRWLQKAMTAMHKACL